VRDRFNFGPSGAGYLPPTTGSAEQYHRSTAFIVSGILLPARRGAVVSALTVGQKGTELDRIIVDIATYIEDEEDYSRYELRDSLGRDFV
jgi:hypothetical protein